MSIHEKIAKDLAPIGGVLRCTTCQRERPLGDVGAKLRDGWPTCCGYTMRWITQRQLAAGAVLGPEGGA